MDKELDGLFELYKVDDYTITSKDGSKSSFREALKTYINKRYVEKDTSLPIWVVEAEAVRSFADWFCNDEATDIFWKQLDVAGTNDFNDLAEDYIKTYLKG